MKLHRFARFAALATLTIVVLILVARTLAQTCPTPVYTTSVFPWAKGTTVNFSFDEFGLNVQDPSNPNPTPKFDLSDSLASYVASGIQEWNNVANADGSSVTFNASSSGSFPWIISVAWPAAKVTYTASNGHTYTYPVNAACSPQPCTDAVAATFYLPDYNSAGGYTGTAAAAVTLINTNGTYTVPNVGTYPDWDPNGTGFGSALQGIGTHETGHGFGLGDEPAGTCGDPMSGWGPATPSDPTGGTNNQGGCQNGFITNCDESEVENNPNGFYAPPSGGGGCCATLRNPKPKVQPVVSCGGGGPGSPIIIDVSGNGFYLTNARNGVLFDITGSGKPIQIAWTAPGADNAFLCLPDSDGRCDDGKDLFGNFTPQPASSTPNGFAALALYDQPANGGNGDGVIDANDAIFSSLRLWIDANHDGISQPNELYTLPALGVESISLDYKASNKKDRYGNVFRYRSSVSYDDPNFPGSRVAYDVFLATSPASPATMTASTRSGPNVPKSGL